MRQMSVKGGINIVLLPYGFLDQDTILLEGLEAESKLTSAHFFIRIHYALITVLDKAT